jgi:hypothetical protein
MIYGPSAGRLAPPPKSRFGLRGAFKFEIEGVIRILCFTGKLLLKTAYYAFLSGRACPNSHS